MVKHTIKLTTTAVGLAMVAILVMGLAGSASAFAATKHKPVVKAVSPNAGTTAGGAKVTVTGKYFMSGGKRVVTKVMFGANAATQLRVKSATKLTVTTPAGTGVVDVRVLAKSSKSAQVKADKYTYRTATQLSVKTGEGQTASAGTKVKVAPSVMVEDASGDPVPGVTVAFAVASGGGSVTGVDATSDASGVATVGSWKLGGTAGANTLTATCAGLTGSPITFLAAGDAGVLTVQHAGTPVRSYSLAELEALPAFYGWAGLGKGTAVGPDAVAGVKVADVVKDALGTPLASTQSVDVAEVDATPYDKVMTYDQLVNLTGFTFWTAADTTVQVTTYKGPMAALLIYSDPAGIVMPAASGPLRFVVGDARNESLVFKPTNLSVSKVNVLNVTP